ncbi:MAG TPA: NAD(P)/FAD-dependent oxidoreductase [Ilumatobacteraceae bacterium]|nr:NAD(P)/FAD-dependent oxidoreductase [Ilumatobacteraceae bacterium]HRB02282.1 NAD(P)/FAD-dependent oxidoreductase [Ilumatobacteraceae bacterium]
MTVEHFDVVVVGAGISGIGAGYHLQTMSPNRSYVILEGRDDIGGTWDLFRYPGVRSDSDMHTLGYSFKPWTAEKSIADGPSILQYLRDTVREFGIDRHIRFGHQITNAEWSTKDARWTVHGQRKDNGEHVTFTCGYLFMCSGYYSYKGGYLPEFAGVETFEGRVVHPQAWPEDLDYAGQRVVVVGSGATAMTLIPAMADTVAHVTMLQRSPTYVVAAPDRDVVANVMRKVLPNKLAYTITRKKNVALQQFLYKRTRTRPDKVKTMLLGRVAKALGPDYDVATHFTPSYNPWDQRMCLVPNGDLFAAIRSGKASVVTDEIDTFTETGIRLKSGTHLPADIIVTATGLNLVTLGEMTFVVDGEPVDFSKTWTYKGFAYSDVPNLASSFGYVNASWTLRADLTCEYVCRLLNHMEATGTVECTPRLRREDAGMPERPWIDNFTAGYMQRVMHKFPRQGDREPWINPQSYTRDKKMFRTGQLEDGAMQFTSAPVVVRSNA